MQQVVYILKCTQVVAMLLTSSTDCLLAVMLPIRYRSRVPPRVVESLNEISKLQTSWSRVYNCRISHLQVPPFNTLLEKSRRLSQNRECKIFDVRWSQRVFPGWYSLHGRSRLSRGLSPSRKSITFLELSWPYWDLFLKVFRRWLQLLLIERELPIHTSTQYTSCGRHFRSIRAHER